jgi:hypothetical protein
MGMDVSHPHSLTFTGAMLKGAISRDVLFRASKFEPGRLRVSEVFKDMLLPLP